jgi:hypothetical protein
MIDELVARSRVERGQGDLLRLTPVGTRVHAVSLERDPGNAAAAGAWRDQGKYLATVDILQRMAGNLDAGEVSRCWGLFGVGRASA